MLENQIMQNIPLKLFYKWFGCISIDRPDSEQSQYSMSLVIRRENLYN